MTDRQLECIVTIANNASITEAAKKLFVSQSSLSQSLSNVERELGVSLFTRSSGNLEMTYAGEEFVHAAREILEIKQNITNRLADLEHSPRGKITVGISQKRSWLFMPSVLAAFMKKYPEAKVVFIEAEQQLLDEIVLTGKADLAFTTQAPVKRELEYHHLYQEHILLALPKDHTLCSEFQRHGIADISRLKETPFILNHQGHDIRAISDRIFRDFHIDPLIILECIAWMFVFNWQPTALVQPLFLTHWKKAIHRKNRCNVFVWAMLIVGRFPSSIVKIYTCLFY